jgi:hypothetical protein
MRCCCRCLSKRPSTKFVSLAFFPLRLLISTPVVTHTHNRRRWRHRKQPSWPSSRRRRQAARRRRRTRTRRRRRASCDRAFRCRFEAHVIDSRIHASGLVFVRFDSAQRQACLEAFASEQFVADWFSPAAKVRVLSFLMIVVRLLALFA